MTPEAIFQIGLSLVERYYLVRKEQFTGLKTS